jgi:hypothetical protein
MLYGLVVLKKLELITLSSEVTKIIEAISEDSEGPAQYGFPSMLKKTISRSLNDYKNINQKDSLENLK